MHYLVSKEFTFDSAHMLQDHKGMCKNLHGHTYKLQVELLSSDTASAGSSEGMVVDFSEISHIIKDLVVSKFDHAFISWENAPVDSEEHQLRTKVEELGMRVVLLPHKPTAELMAEHIFNTINLAIRSHVSKRISEKVRVCSVKLWETPTSMAMFTA